MSRCLHLSRPLATTLYIWYLGRDFTLIQKLGWTGASWRIGSAPVCNEEFQEFVSPVLPFGLCNFQGFQKATVLPLNFNICLGP